MADINVKDVEATADSPNVAAGQLTPQELERTRKLLNLLSDTELQSLLPRATEAANKDVKDFAVVKEESLREENTKKEENMAADFTDDDAGLGNVHNNGWIEVADYEENRAKDYVEPWFLRSRLTRRWLKTYVHAQDLLPDDTFSFFMTAKILSVPFLMATLVTVLKFSAYVSVTVDVIDVDSSSNIVQVPAGVEGSVRVSQIVSLLLSVLSQEDVTHSLRSWRNGCTYPLLRREFPDVAHESNLRLSIRWFSSLGLRLVGGLYGQLLTFLLIMQADKVLDVLLNYAAMSFIANIDNIVFALGRTKYWGEEVKRHCNLVLLSDNPDGMPIYCGKYLHTLTLFLLYAILLIGWGVIATRQDNGEYLCKTILVRVDDNLDPTLGAFNGLYDRAHPDSFSIFKPQRAFYIERLSGVASFGYCRKNKNWAFRYSANYTAEEVAAGMPDDEYCNRTDAFSSKTTSFDLLETMTTANWFTTGKRGRVYPLQGDIFSGECFDCETQLFANCGGNGVCIPNKGCECDSGWFGIRCEMATPCDEVHTDLRGGNFKSTRSWSDKYALVRVDTNGTVNLGGREDSGYILTIYDRPVYAFDYGSSGRKDILFYMGRRWGLTTLDLIPNISQLSQLPSFAETFHAEYSPYAVEFLTESVEVSIGGETPVELAWYRAKSKSSWLAGMQEVDTTLPSDATFLCTSCNNDTNPCFFREFCSYTGVCQRSSTGSKGPLCQVPPLGDGQCDAKYNTYQFQRDGGDCCEHLCVSAEYTCGRDRSGYLDVGYFSCIFPDNDPKLFGETIDSTVAAFSDNGAMLATTHTDYYGNDVRVYDQDGSHWLQRGDPLTFPSWWVGDTEKVGYGRSIAIKSILSNVFSNPLLRPTVGIIAGCPGCEAAFVTLCGSYGCKSDDAQVLVADTGMEALFGYSVDMSSNVARVAVSSFGKSSIPESGYVRVWQMQETNIFTPLGNLIVPNVTKVLPNITQASIMQHILSIALSGDGTTLAFVTGDEEGTMSIQVYAWSAEAWTLVGDPIVARFCLKSGHQYTDLVALSNNGNVLAAVIGEVGVHVYDWKAARNEWVQRGNETLDPVAGEDCQLLQAVALNSDGRVIAVGSFRTEDFAYLRVYQWTGSEWSSAGARRKISQETTLSLTSSGKKVAVSRPVAPSSNGVTGMTAIYSLPNIRRCGQSETFVHLSFVATNTTTWKITDNRSGLVLHEGGSYEGNDSHSVAEGICLMRGTCGLLSVRNTTDFYAYWGSGANQEISGAGGVLNQTIGSCAP